MRLLRQHIEQLESMQKGTDIDVQLERLFVYGMRNLLDFVKYTALSMAESLVSDTKQHSHPKASFLSMATWIRILNSSKRTSSPSLQRKSTLRCLIVSPKWISLFARIVLALNFLQVALPGGLLDPVVF